MDHESIFEGRDEVTVQFCELRVMAGEIVVTRILRKQTAKVAKLPPPGEARKLIGPGEALLVEDILYAWIPPETASVVPVEAASEPASASPSEPVSEPGNEPASVPPQMTSGADEPQRPLAREPVTASVESDPIRAGRSQEATMDAKDPVDATERLARVSYEILRKNEELIERHMRRMKYLDDRQQELDRRAEAIARAQVEQLTVLREVTADVAAGVKQVTQRPDPAQLPEDYRRACDDLSAAQSMPFGLVAEHIGAFLKGAGANWFFPSDVNAGPAE